MNDMMYYGRTLVSLIPFILPVILILSFYIEVKKRRIELWKELSRDLLIAAVFMLLAGIFQNMDFFVPEYHDTWFLAFAACCLFIGVFTMKAIDSAGKKMSQVVGDTG